MVDDPKRGRPSNDDLIKKLTARLDEQDKKMAEMADKNATLEKQVQEKGSELKAFLAGTSVGRQRDGKINQSSPPPTKPVLKDEPAYLATDRKTPMDYKKDVCPYCKVTEEPNFVDQTPWGRWQCRVCAKNWEPWTWKYPYSLMLEQSLVEHEYLKLVALEEKGLASPR